MAAAFLRQPAVSSIASSGKNVPPAVQHGWCLTRVCSPCWSAEIPQTPLCTDPTVSAVNQYCLACGGTNGHRVACVAAGGSACMVRWHLAGSCLQGVCVLAGVRPSGHAAEQGPGLAPLQDGSNLIPLCTDPSLSPATELRDGCPVSLTSGGELHWLRSKETAPPVGDGVAQCATPGGYRGGASARTVLPPV